MSTAQDRETAIISEVRDLSALYASAGKPPSVRMFAEDYAFLLKRKMIIELDDGAKLDGNIAVVKGGRRKTRFSKKPPEYLV